MITSDRPWSQTVESRACLPCLLAVWLWVIDWISLGHNFLIYKTVIVLGPGEGNGNPLQCSCLENPVDRGGAAVHRVTQCQKWLSMHACIGEGNGNPLQCSCLENPVDRGGAAVHRVTQCQKWLRMHACMHWRRKWQPTPVFLPGESQGRGSLAGCHLWGRTESDTTEATQQQQQQQWGQPWRIIVGLNYI